MNKLFTFAANSLGFTSLASPRPEIKTPIDPLKELGPKEVFVSWELVPHMQTPRLDQKGRRTVIVVLIMLGLLLLLMQEFWLILMIACIIFFLYVVTTTPALPIKYELSSYGLRIDEKQYYWAELKRYFFYISGDQELLVLDTYLSYPARFYITFDQKNKHKISEILDLKVEFCKEDPTGSLDKTVTRFTQKFDFNQKKS